MCQDQPAQIDCRVEFCAFYSGGGQCSNVSPAITLNPGGGYVCWSEETSEKIVVDKHLTKAEEEIMKVLAVNDYTALEVETNEQDWPLFRRYGADAWEVCMHDSWEPVDCRDQLGELEDAFQKFMREESDYLALQDEDVTSRPGKIVEVDMLQDVGMAEVAKRMKEQLRKLTADAQRPLFYRRCGPGVWEGKRLDYWEWEKVDDPAMLAELEYNYQESIPEQEETMSTLRTPEERCIDDFEWKADLSNEMAQIKEALEYLAWIGMAFYPWWDWKVCDPMYSSLFKRDCWGLRVRQWRGAGFSKQGLLANGGKWGVILVISEEALVRLWHGSPERKLEVARQITRETIENVYLIAEGDFYPEFVPIIEDEEAEEETLL